MPPSVPERGLVAHLAHLRAAAFLEAGRMWPEYEEELDSFTIVPCRGRKAGKTTRVGEKTFTIEQLDSIAPLTTLDTVHLTKKSPPDDVHEHIQARIAEAKRLKFGGING